MGMPMMVTQYRQPRMRYASAIHTPQSTSHTTLATVDAAPPPVGDVHAERREREPGHLERLQPERDADDRDAKDASGEAPRERGGEPAEDDPDDVGDERHRSSYHVSAAERAPLSARIRCVHFETAPGTHSPACGDTDGISGSIQ